MIKLSASSIQSLNDCSWLYYYKYHLKGPQDVNKKTVMGSVIHEFFEILGKKRHSACVRAVQEVGIMNAESLVRLGIRLLKKYNLEVDEWFDDFIDLATAGLLDDFYDENSDDIYEPEYEFIIQTDKYILRGFIDRHARYKDKIKIKDFKSKSKIFSEEELQENIQALIYMFALYKLKGFPSDVEFKLLRHNKTQTVEWCGEDAIKGLGIYLDYLADYLSDFNYKKTISNLAAQDKKKRWMCGYGKFKNQLKKDGEPFYACCARFPKIIYYINDKDGSFKYSVENEKDIELKEGDFVEKWNYAGCPAFNSGSYE